MSFERPYRERGSMTSVNSITTTCTTDSNLSGSSLPSYGSSLPPGGSSSSSLQPSLPPGGSSSSSLTPGGSNQTPNWVSYPICLFYMTGTEDSLVDSGHVFMWEWIPTLTLRRYLLLFWFRNLRPLGWSVENITRFSHHLKTHLITLLIHLCSIAYPSDWILLIDLWGDLFPHFIFIHPALGALRIISAGQEWDSWVIQDTRLTLSWHHLCSKGPPVMIMTRYSYTTYFIFC